MKSNIDVKTTTMDLKAYDIYQLSEDREKKLWSDCIFVFDTSALLSFYLCPEDTMNQICSEVFENVKGKLWIPNHVQFEYLKNRVKKIHEPISNSYNPLKEKSVKAITKTFADVSNLIDDLKNKVKNSDNHPHMDLAEIENFKLNFDKFLKTVPEFEKKIGELIDKKISEISNLEKNDTVFEKLNKYFAVGPQYTFTQIMELTKEGKHRYELSIPPGYQDLKTKFGTQIFGDLIVWKQILDFSKEKKKNIIFICNDLKEDWWELYDDKKGKKQTAGPRRELIKEITDFSGINFWMYTQEQFLRKSNSLLNSNIPNSKIEQISKFVSSTTLDKFLHYKCNVCKKEDKIDTKKLHLEFDCIGGSERNMGMENQYSSEASFGCNHCENTIHALFEVWEYPVGIINYQQVSLDGAALIKESYIDIDLSDEEPYDNSTMENYVLNREQINLKAAVTKNITLTKMIDADNTVFQIETAIEGKGLKRVEFEVYNAQGYRIKQPIILDQPITRFQMRAEDENFLSKFLFINLTSPTDLIIALSVIEYDEDR